jgi:XTP/dITP diphosphohydrolase
MLEIVFATGNKHKFDEASSILADAGVSLIQHPLRHREIRSESLEEIARESVEAAFAQVRKPVFVEDSGLFIESLNGFPGAYSAWALQKLGLAGILRLMDGIGDRSASFRACIAFHDGERVHAFSGECKGRVSGQERGEEGFGYDPIFVPQGQEKTFAENITLKNNISHRYKTLLEFSKFLRTR